VKHEYVSFVSTGVVVVFGVVVIHWMIMMKMKMMMMIDGWWTMILDWTCFDIMIQWSISYIDQLLFSRPSLWWWWWWLYYDDDDEDDDSDWNLGRVKDEYSYDDDDGNTVVWSVVNIRRMKK
jgi:hypothetical protein